MFYEVGRTGETDVHKRAAVEDAILGQYRANYVGAARWDSPEDGIELIAPNRRNRSKTQDDCKLRRYRKRWKVERLFARLHTFRRLVIRWEYRIQYFLGFVHLACLQLLLGRL